jgi:hypothetical protein
MLDCVLAVKDSANSVDVQFLICDLFMSVAGIQSNKSVLIAHSGGCCGTNVQWGRGTGHLHFLRIILPAGFE